MPKFHNITAYYKTSIRISENIGLIPKRIHDAGQYNGETVTNQSPGTDALLLYNCKIVHFLYINLIEWYNFNITLTLTIRTILKKKIT